jgi:hypothetical protein
VLHNDTTYQSTMKIIIQASRINLFERGSLRGRMALWRPRRGFFLINVDVPEEIFTTLGRVIVENFHVDIYPIMPFAKPCEVFAMWD